jgi:hypothetical protein
VLIEQLKQAGVEPVAIQGTDVDTEAEASVGQFARTVKDTRADIVASFLYGGTYAS